MTIDDVAHRDVGRMRAVPAAPAEMKTDSVLGQAAQRVVERLDPDHREFLVGRDARLGVHHVPIVGDCRIVELQDKAGIKDRLVFLAQRLGPGVEELLVAPVIGVRDAVGAPGSNRGHEPFLDPGVGEACLEIGDVGGDRLLPV